jgi:hypothetical protein
MAEKSFNTILEELKRNTDDPVRLRVIDTIKGISQLYLAVKDIFTFTDDDIPEFTRKKRTSSNKTAEAFPELKEIILKARENNLNFTLKDMVSAQRKGKEGTRFSDPDCHDSLSQKYIDTIFTVTESKEEAEILFVMYINRFCCEEKRGSFIWKEVSSDGTLMYSKKTQEEVKDILSLYTANGEDAYTLYMSSPYRLVRLT